MERPTLTGRIVRLANPADEAERAARFVVTEDNGDRLRIRLVCDLPIAPVETVRPDDVTPAE